MRIGISSARLANFITQWWPFVLLCAVWSVRLIFAEEVPSFMPKISSLGTAAAAACVVCTLLGAIRHETIPPKSTVGHSALLGAFIFCGAQIALLLRPQDVGGSDLLLAASLIPVVIAVTSASTTEAGLSTVLLLAGIAAATSLLLLFPEPRIHTLAGASVLVLLPVMTGVGAALLSTDICSIAVMEFCLRLCRSDLRYSCGLPSSTRNIERFHSPGWHLPWML